MHFLKGTPHQETLIMDVNVWSLLVYFLCLPWYVLTPWGLPTCRTCTCTSCPETIEVKQQWSVAQDQVMQMSPRTVWVAHAQMTPYQLRDRGFVLCCSDKSIGAPPARLLTSNHRYHWQLPPPPNSLKRLHLAFVFIYVLFRARK